MLKCRRQRRETIRPVKTTPDVLVSFQYSRSATVEGEGAIRLGFGPDLGGEAPHPPDHTHLGLPIPLT